MTHDPTDIPAELRISLDAVPLVETRAVLGREINQCHAPTVPEDGGRFALLLHDGCNRRVAGLSDMLVW